VVIRDHFPNLQSTHYTNTPAVIFYAVLPSTTLAVTLVDPSFHFTYCFLRLRVLGRHYISTPKLKGVLSYVCSDRYHSGASQFAYGKFDSW